MWSGRTRHIQRPPIARINALAHELQRSGKSLINLGQAVLGLSPPQAAMDAAQGFMESTPVHGYSPDPGIPELRAEVAAWLRRDKAMAEASASRILMTCGANQAFVNAILAITDPGDEVVVFSPYYFDHVFAIQLAGCVPVEVPMKATPRGDGTGQRLALDLDALADSLSSKTRAVTLVSPGNPTGAVADLHEIQGLAALCRERDLWLLSDETYDLLTFPPSKHRSPAAVAPSPKTVTMGSFSKIFAMASWRLGYLYGSEAFIEETIKVQDGLVVCAPVPSQKAGLGALKERETYVPSALAELTRRRDTLLESLAKSRLFEILEPEGGTSVWAEMTQSALELLQSRQSLETWQASQDPAHENGGDPSFALAKALLEEAGIISVPGSAFGSKAHQSLRLSFGNQPPHVLREAAQQLEAFEGRLLA